MNVRPGHEALFQRHPGNPILSAADWPYPGHTAFNPGATRLKDGSTLLLVRVEDRRGLSHLCAARSRDGIGGWIVDRAPTLVPFPEEHPEELWGIEDPRITYLEELERYAVTATAFGPDGPAVSLFLTEDFSAFERVGRILMPNNKDAALLPRRVDGRFVLYHRPLTDSGSHLWVSRSPDLRHWGDHEPVLRARKGAWWDAGKVGLSPPPIATPRGWLTLYHGVRLTAAGCLYRLGLALFALDRPDCCLLRGREWILGPEAEYEQVGDVGYVAFACGLTLGDDGDRIHLYYGAADTTTALALGSVRECLAWLDAHGTTPPDAKGCLW